MGFHLFTSITSSGGGDSVFLLKDLAGPMVALIVGSFSVWIARSNNLATLQASKEALVQSESNVLLQIEFQRKEKYRDLIRDLGVEFNNSCKRQNGVVAGLRRVELDMSLLSDAFATSREPLLALQSQGTLLANKKEDEELEKLRISQMLDLILNDGPEKAELQESLKPYFNERTANASEMQKQGKRMHLAIKAAIEAV
jgi:plasmid maintenance system antidote protein VapI